MGPTIQFNLILIIPTYILSTVNQVEVDYILYLLIVFDHVHFYCIFTQNLETSTFNIYI